MRSMQYSATCVKQLHLVRHTIRYSKCLHAPFILFTHHAGVYFCSICNFWDHRAQEKKYYHCHGCGMCRVGGAERCGQRCASPSSHSLLVFFTVLNTAAHALAPAALFIATSAGTASPASRRRTARTCTNPAGGAQWRSLTL